MSEDKKKLSDIVAKSVPAFGGGKTSDFSEAYPRIATMNLVVNERTLHGIKNTWTFNSEYFLNVINCSNPACQKGGVRLGAELHRIVAVREEAVNRMKDCEGAEIFGKRGQADKSCTHVFEIVGNVTYKEEAPLPAGE